MNRIHVVTAGSRTQVPTLLIDVLLCIELLIVLGLMSGRQTATFQVHYLPLLDIQRVTLDT